MPLGIALERIFQDESDRDDFVCRQGTSIAGSVSGVCLGTATNRLPSLGADGSTTTVTEFALVVDRIHGHLNVTEIGSDSINKHA